MEGIIVGGVSRLRSPILTNIIHRYRGGGTVTLVGGYLYSNTGVVSLRLSYLRGESGGSLESVVSTSGLPILTLGCGSRSS